MIVMSRRRPAAYSLPENVWLAGVQMKLRAQAEALGVPFVLKLLPEDDEIDKGASITVMEDSQCRRSR